MLPKAQQRNPAEIPRGFFVVSGYALIMSMLFRFFQTKDVVDTVYKLGAFR